MKGQIVWQSKWDRIVAHQECDPFKLDDAEDPYVWMFTLERLLGSDRMGGGRWECVYVPQYVLEMALKGMGKDLSEFSPLYSHADPEVRDE